jgi:hypothetical protein
VGPEGPTVVLIGLDVSRTSLRAGAYAAGLARRQHARLVAVYARTGGSLGGLPGQRPGQEREADKGELEEPGQRDPTATGKWSRSTVLAMPCLASTVGTVADADVTTVA